MFCGASAQTEKPVARVGSGSPRSRCTRLPPQHPSRAPLRDVYIRPRSSVASSRRRSLSPLLFCLLLARGTHGFAMARRNVSFLDVLRPTVGIAYRLRNSDCRGNLAPVLAEIICHPRQACVFVHHQRAGQRTRTDAPQLLHYHRMIFQVDLDFLHTVACCVPQNIPVDFPPSVGRVPISCRH